MPNTSAGTGLTRVDSINEAVASLAHELSITGPHRREDVRRGQKVMEFCGPQLVEITLPTNNTLLLVGRKDNPWANMAEFPWIIAGRGDIAWLSHYLPRAKEFSDDGLTWRAAYGPRLRAWSGGHAGVKFDQLARVVTILKESPDSRQAVISLWDPLADLAPVIKTVPNEYGGYDDVYHKYKDYPCTNWLHFQIVDGALDLTVAMRSNDLFWGFSAVNVLNFTNLQQLVAACLDVPEGIYRHMASNLHVYERHYGTLEMLAKPQTDMYDHLDAEWMFGLGGVDLPTFTRQCHSTLDFVTALRGKGWAVLSDVHTELDGFNDYLLDWAYFMLLHNMATSTSMGWSSGVEKALLDIRREDWRMAATAYIMRTWHARGQITDSEASDMATTIGQSTFGYVASSLLITHIDNARQEKL